VTRASTEATESAESAAAAATAATGAHTAAQVSAASVEGALEQSQRISEAFGARERRTNEAVTAVFDAQQELRTAVGLLQQATKSLKREMERQTANPTVKSELAPATGTISDALDSHRYVGFEEQFRGSPDEIRQRLLDYPPIFANASDVLDLGCGRGEFLALLQENGVTARGIDVNQAMVDVCHERGLEAKVGDALGYMASLPDRSLGGLFSAQVVEHLEPGYLVRVLDTAFDKLSSGAPIVLETINPACWFAFFESYIRDLSHVRPIHPETLQYLLVASGFQRVEIQYRVPYPEHEKLQALPTNVAPEIRELTDTFNANAERLNKLLFTWLDYSVVGWRP
jgi:O-antigen chain-terminating methyltransferase